MIDYVITGASADKIWPLVRDFHYSHRMSAAIFKIRNTVKGFYPKKAS